MWTKIRYWRSLLDILGSMAKTHSPLVFSLLALALIGTRPSTAAKCKEKSKTFIGELELRDDDKQALLDVHNQFRQQIASGVRNLEYKIQPQAKNMLQLTWDEYAAKKASSLAKTCVYDHDNPTDEQGKPLGQNLGIRRTTSRETLTARQTFNNWKKLIVTHWFKEVNNYTYGDPFSYNTGHYTQLVWATTAKLGCGYVLYKETHPDKKIWQKGYLVCNYNPAGNWKGKKPYDTGYGNCDPEKYRSSRKYKYLCVKI